MAGIYIHIPYCKQACSYCNFHFSTNNKNQEKMVDAICKEISIRAANWQGVAFETLYFGGGTPSILSADAIEKIMQQLMLDLDISKLQEITLEANPDDIEEQKLKAWKSLGINRLSIGIQSFRDQDLQLMNRSHTAKQALNCLNTAMNAGFEKFSLDLIYGLPNLSTKAWIENLEQVKKLGAKHLSAYALTVEENTALDYQIKSSKIQMPEDNLVLEHFQALQNWSEQNGWRHYELSNLALPKHEAMHNSSYWKNEIYLGLGPAAHGFTQDKRYANISNNALYLASIAEGKTKEAIEILSKKDKFNEACMVALRMDTGLDLSILQSLSMHDKKDFLKSVHDLKAQGKLIEESNRLMIPKEFRFQSDGIAADLFLI